MWIAICCIIAILVIYFVIISYRKQKQKHQQITQDLVKTSRTPVLLQSPDVVYYGLASLGTLQPHQLLSILVINEDQLFLVVPPVGLMSKIELILFVFGLLFLEFANELLLLLLLLYSNSACFSFSIQL